MEFKIIQTMLRGLKLKKMKASKKLEIVSIIFMITILLVVIFTTNIIHFSVIPEIIGSDWLTVNNTGLLAVCGVEWWQNHTMLIIMQVFVLALGLGIFIMVLWGCLSFIEAVSLLGYYILKQRWEKISYIFECLVEGSFISMLEFEDFFLENRIKNIITRFASILGAHILFFILTPFLVVLWATKWFTAGLFYLLKQVV